MALRDTGTDLVGRYLDQEATSPSVPACLDLRSRLAVSLTCQHCLRNCQRISLLVL